MRSAKKATNMQDGFYTSISEMEPMMPSDRKKALEELAIEVIRKSSAMSSSLHPITRRGIVELVRKMNSYYSNRIEGHNTHPADIERALRDDLSSDPAKRAMQLEGKAHIEVQKLVENRIEKEPDLAVTGRDFLCWIHKEFYNRMPDEYLAVKREDGSSERVVPGEMRKTEVVVGRHLPPRWDCLGRFMERFEEVYNPHRLGSVDRVISAAASHHRLAWIHPFLDGNGRVTRLMTHACLKKAGIDGHGLWTVSRGFARFRDEYMSALAGADQPRSGDLDGRGNLSDRGLFEFCRFFLETAIDQIDFMSSLLDLDGMIRRIEGFVSRKVSLKEMKPETGRLLRDLFLRGEIARGEIPGIVGMPERTARRLVGPLLKEGYIVSDSEKGAVRLGFPPSCVGYYFPRLYPPDIEAGLNP